MKPNVSNITWPGAHFIIKQWLLRIFPNSNNPPPRLSGVGLIMMKKEGHSLFFHKRPTFRSSHHLSPPPQPRPGQTFTCTTWLWLLGLLRVLRGILGDQRILPAVPCYVIMPLCPYEMTVLWFCSTSSLRVPLLFDGPVTGTGCFSAISFSSPRNNPCWRFAESSDSSWNSQIWVTAWANFFF